MKVTRTFSTEIHKICLAYPYWVLCPSMGLDEISWVWTSETNEATNEKYFIDAGVPDDFTGVTFSYGYKPIKSEDLQEIANRCDGKILLLESGEEYEGEKECCYYNDLGMEVDISFTYQGWEAHLRFKSRLDMERAGLYVCKLFEIKSADFFNDAYNYGWYPHAPESLDRLALEELVRLQNLQAERVATPLG